MPLLSLSFSLCHFGLCPLSVFEAQSKDFINIHTSTIGVATSVYQQGADHHGFQFNMQDHICACWITQRGQFIVSYEKR